MVTMMLVFVKVKLEKSFPEKGSQPESDDGVSICAG